MNEKQIAFVKSYDFMRLGQAINRGQWQSAAMTIRRMTQMAAEAEFTSFDRQLAGLRQSIARKNVQESKQILAVLINRRGNLLKDLLYIPKEDI